MVSLVTSVFGVPPTITIPSGPAAGVYATYDDALAALVTEANAAVGAAMGSIVPLVGTAIGAILGGLAGGTAGYFGGKLLGMGTDAVGTAITPNPPVVMDPHE